MKRKGDVSSNGETKGLTSGAPTPSSAKSAAEKLEREELVLWRRPWTTFNYFLLELSISTVAFGRRAASYTKTVVALALIISLLIVAAVVNGPHQPFFQSAKKSILWSLYWTGLGVLSSIGLGTGLHTFLLYLGPHIAAVTLAGYECGSLNFPEPPYPDSIICPETMDPNWLVSVLNIMKKVHLEAILWGAGTALGELPPYFMARAARLSGSSGAYANDQDLKEFEELQKKKKSKQIMNIVDEIKLFVERLVHRVGFFGILVCASVPNPLFDLAGMTCGHFLVPFWTFFGATLIGKAIVKMSVQSIFVIVAFSNVLVTRVSSFLGTIPVVGAHLEGLIAKMLEFQRNKLRHSSNPSSADSPPSNPISSLFEMLVFAMVGYFVISIVNSVAQSHHKRIFTSTSTSSSSLLTNSSTTNSSRRRKNKGSQSQPFSDHRRRLD